MFEMTLGKLIVIVLHACVCAFVVRLSFSFLLSADVLVDSNSLTLSVVGFALGKHNCK